MSKQFSIPVLGIVVHHTKETRESLRPHIEGRKQLEFIRSSIVEFARKKGFRNNSINGRKPSYIPARIWKAAILAQGKSYRVSFLYVDAFHWLKALPEYECFDNGKLIRGIITNSLQ